LSVVLLLTAVMVTAKRHKERIARERISQADEAATEPKDGNKVIAQAANATKSIQADAAASTKPLYTTFKQSKLEESCKLKRRLCEVMFPNELCLPTTIQPSNCGTAYGCSADGYCWSSCVYDGYTAGWRWMYVDQQDGSTRWLRCSPKEGGAGGAGACVDNAEAVGKFMIQVPKDKRKDWITKAKLCHVYGTTSSAPNKKPCVISGFDLASSKYHKFMGLKCGEEW